ncbi:MAG: stimulus-sensing domain-containing protein [Alphaproteobacteria bacterium]
MTAGTDTTIAVERERRAKDQDRAVAGTIGRFWRRVTFGGFSSLSRRIVFLNLVALVALVAAILFLNQSRSSLIDAEVRSLTAQGELIANSIAAQATNVPGAAVLRSPQEALDLEAAAAYVAGLEFPIDPARAGTLITYLSASAGPRVRVYDAAGYRIVDSDSAEITRADLPPIGQSEPSLLERIWNSVTGWFRRDDLPIYAEYDRSEGLNYEEVAAAISGDMTTLTRVTESGELMVTVAVPIQGYQTIQGAVLLTTREGDIDDIIAEERNAILRVFAVAAVSSVLLSFFLAGTIAAPLRRLASAADHVRKGVRSRPQIPDFSKRGDEIGDLSLALRDMTSSLFNRIDAIERFAADVSHELKNPLTSLRSAVETFPLAKTKESQERLAEIIQHDIRRLDRLISDISDASRLDAELSRRDAEPFDLSKLLQTLVTLSNESSDGESRLVLSIEEAGNDGYVVLGHDIRITQVLSNLVDNARSFSPPGRDIRISARRDGTDVEILIDDSGPGIKAENVERIFERFYTDRPGTEAFGENSGLGLSISRQIVEAHGGQIWAENIPSGGNDEKVIGARFGVRLPVSGR